jgi:hypothetical protein
MTENEAKAWKALAATYAQCVEIAIQQWDPLIGIASMAQEKKALEMRDRAIDVGVEPGSGAVFGGTALAEIHVPLFTHRDRLQFLKEVSVTLLIEASKRGLSVTQPEDVGPMVKPFGKDKGTPLTSMSTEDLESAIAWCRDKGDRLIKYGDFVIAADAEAHARAAKTAEIQTQPLNETPLALVPDDRPLTPAQTAIEAIQRGEAEAP